MKKSSKAVLLSALVLPGAGHVFLKRYVSAMVLIGISLAALYVLISTAVEQALQISEKILNGEIQPDIASIAQMVSESSIGAETQLVSLSTTALILVWLVSIIDSFRAGRLQDGVSGTKN
jgi:hypothetical protein